MDVQKPAIYLTCIKNRGFQKKHIEVCKKCSSRDGCKEYQTHKQMRSAQAKPDEPLPKPFETLLVDIIKQLREIKKALGDDRPPPPMDNPSQVDPHTGASWPEYVKAALERIRSLCSAPDRHADHQRPETEI
jgi:hypothetical protein